jgi:copper chaperone CopZ
VKAVSDGLRRLDGVDSVHVDLQANLVTITLDPRVEVNLRSIPEAVRGSGFTPGEMCLRARGEYEGESDTRMFRISGWSRSLPLTSGGRAGTSAVLNARVDYSGQGGVRLIEIVQEP